MKKILIVGVTILMAVSSSANQPGEALPFPVYLNHFFLVIDATTFADIEKSEFLRKAFAPNETRTTKRTDISYTGLYFYGVNTYFEFFDVSKETTRKLGDTGIAFGVEQEGAEKILQSRLQSNSPNKVTRLYNEKQVDWFYMLTPKGSTFTSGNNIFVMEYIPTFLREWNPQADDSQGITRQQILKRYAAALKERPPSPCFEDVISMTVALDQGAAMQLTEACQVFGYRMKREDEATVLEGEGFSLRLLPEALSTRGIQQITLRVRSAPPQKEFHFGSRSVLKFQDDKTATWSF
jgi:hypothetical protein